MKIRNKGYDLKTGAVNAAVMWRN